MTARDVSRSAASTAPPLASLTTLRVGGPPRALVAVDSFAQALQTLSDLDEAGTAYWPLGGGSNMVVADDGIDAVVVWLRNRSLEWSDEPGGPDGQPGSVRVRVGAGMVWDEFVAECARRGWSGVEALSGIPGTVGATPVQNVGAYGAQVSDVITEVTVWDRRRREVRTVSASECGFGYRDSAFKIARLADGSPAMVVVQVEFRLQCREQSAPVRYAELAGALGVDLGQCAPVHRVREAVLRLRAAKGMVVDEADHDTWSVGSFFTNPVVSAQVAQRLPDSAPRWPVGGDVGGDVGGAVDGEQVKLSAAWLVEHAGFAKGHRLPGADVALSSKHALAITNRGAGTARQVCDLAAAVRDAVQREFGVTLEVEPVLLGVTL